MRIAHVFVAISFVFFCILSCQPVVDFDLQTEPPKLVIWSFLHPDSIPRAYVSRTSKPLSKDTSTKITDANVILFEDNLVFDTLLSLGKGIYQSANKKKLQVGKVYYYRVIKEGFLPVETPKDTMPNKPIVLSYEAFDSIRQNQSINVGLIKIHTNQPSHYKNYGFNSFKVSSPILPLQHVSVSEKGNNTCENNGFFSLYNFSFLKSNCRFSDDNYELLIDNFFPKGFKKATISFSICSITSLNIEYSERIDLLSYYFTNFYSGVDLFWNPVYLPEYVKNGYGFFGCYNTTDVSVSFK